MTASASTSVAILAGGLATRMRPITQKIPKAMIEVHGRPFMEHQLALLRAQGFTDMVVLTGFLGDLIEEHFGDGAKLGVQMRYSPDGPTLLGTGGALLKALPLLTDPFVVLYGDSYLVAPYGPVLDFYRERAGQASPRPAALMTVYHNDSSNDRSNIVFADDRIQIYDKKKTSPGMEWIDWGLGILNHAAFAGRKPGAVFDLADLYQQLIAEDRMLGYEVHERFHEIGSPEGLARLTHFLSNRPHTESRSNP